jgi:SAM-dependent methyltransferase
MKIPLVLFFFVLFWASAPAQSAARLKKMQSYSYDSLYKTLEKELQFLDFQPFEFVADIGSYDGYYPVAYSIFQDFVHFTLQDISNDGFYQLDSLLILARAKKKKPLTCTYKIVIGNDSISNCANATFDKVILRDVLHHTVYPAAFLQEMKRLLKPNASLFLMEPIRTNTSDDVGICTGAMTQQDLWQFIENQGFRIIKNEQFYKRNEWIKCIVK